MDTPARRSTRIEISQLQFRTSRHREETKWDERAKMTVMYPDPFLEVRVNKVDLTLPLQALCAGYEASVWRSLGLADHLFGWVPYVALMQEHQLSFGSNNFVDLLKAAAAHIYNTKKTESRGELGEILLHLACVLHFGCEPVVCKLMLKSSSNDTVKGFDGIHVKILESSFEIWLGESKFYTDPRKAIRDAVTSVKEHLLPTFLKGEKAMLFGHVGKDVPRRDEIIKLFKSSTSIDELLKVAVFPILVAYESEAVGAFNEVCEQYVNMLETEVGELQSYFGTKASGISLTFQLILVPLGSKEAVVTSFDEKLKPFLK